MGSRGVHAVVPAVAALLGRCKWKLVAVYECAGVVERRPKLTLLQGVLAHGSTARVASTGAGLCTPCILVVAVVG